MRRIARSRAAVCGLLVASLGGAARAASAQTPSGAEVVSRYVAAIGGEAALERFTARHMVMEMEVPMVGTMTMETFNARPNLVLVRMRMPGEGEMLRGYDGEVGWISSPGQGASILSGDELREVMRQADFDASHYHPGSFPTLETVGEAAVAGRACWEVRMVHRSGSESRNCFDKETGLLLGFTMRRETAAGETEVASRVEDYREFDGMRMPTRLITDMMGMELVATVRSVSHAPIDRSVFELPPQLRARSGN